MFMLRSGPKMEPTLSQFILNFCERSHCFHNMFFEILKKDTVVYTPESSHLPNPNSWESAEKFEKSEHSETSENLKK